MGELASISFAARLVRVREESALGDVRIFALVTAGALAMFGEVEAKMIGTAALAAAFRRGWAVGRGLARRAGIATGGSMRDAFVVSTTVVLTVGIGVFGSAALEAGALGAEHGYAATWTRPVGAPPGALVSSRHSTIRSIITLALIA